MGTKLHCSLNLLTTLLKNNHGALTIALYLPDTWISSNHRQLKVGILARLHQLLQAMDKPPEQSNREYVRKTILKHEEIFKQQVHELHQLYSVQKNLMIELRSTEMSLNSHKNSNPGAIRDPRAGIWNSASTYENSNCSYAANNKHRYEIPRSQVLSQCSQDHLRMNIGIDLVERPIIEDKIISQSHSKEKMRMEAPGLWTDVENEIELTLSIGCGASKKKTRVAFCSEDELDGSKAAPSEAMRLISTIPVKADGEAGIEASASSGREKLRGPPWLIQAFNLKGT